MLKLIYRNPVFGPIDLEYDRPVICVGSCDDNDLVLRHPSVHSHHCLLVFREEKLLCLPPDQTISLQVEVSSLAGAEYGPGDQLWIGELEFILAHSSRSLALPETLGPGSESETTKAGTQNGVDPDGYFCPQCRVHYRAAEVKRLGFVGGPRRCLCPKCSRVLGVEPAPQQTANRPRKR